MLYQWTHSKDMRDAFTMLHRLRVIAHFNAREMRHFILGMAVAINLLKRSTRRMGCLQSKMKTIFLLVCVPIMLPPAILIGLPLFLLALPLISLATMIHTLNTRANSIRRQKYQQPRDAGRKGRFFFAFSTSRHANSAHSAHNKRGNPLCKPSKRNTKRTTSSGSVSSAAAALSSGMRAGIRVVRFQV
jgi:hypothetical protein